MKPQSNLDLYYQRVYNRSKTRYRVAEFLAEIGSPFRLVLEVFIRRNFGERYLSVSEAVVLLLLVSPIPVIHTFFNTQKGESFSWLFLILHYASWYALSIWCVRTAIERRREIKRRDGSFDSMRFSKYNGDIHPAFLKVFLKGKRLEVRQIETLLEPCFFLAIGVALFMLGQYIGAFIVFSSLMYSLSYKAVNYLGDSTVLDELDKLILDEEKLDAFVHLKEASATRGIRAYGRMPADEGLRRKLVDRMLSRSQAVPELQVS